MVQQGKMPSSITVPVPSMLLPNSSDATNQKHSLSKETLSLIKDNSSSKNLAKELLAPYINIILVWRAMQLAMAAAEEAMAVPQEIQGHPRK
jgi:hypothetical protein